MLESAIAQAKSGDMSAFGDLYDASYEQIYRMIFHRTLDDVFTEDIISLVYMKALKQIKNLKWSSEWEYFAWLRRIAYTTLIDSLRWQKPTDSLEDIEWEIWYSLDISQDIDHKNMIEKVLGYMDTFSERDRMILTLRIWDDLSYEEIREITWESVSNSKKIVSRSLAKIAANVEQFALLTLLLNHVFYH